MPTATASPEAGQQEETLSAIFARLDQGEIDVQEAHADVQEYDKRHRSYLDVFLAVLAR